MNIKTRDWFVINTLPISGFVCIVGFAVIRFPGNRVSLTPGLLLGLIDLLLFLLGKLLAGNEFPCIGILL